jgi:Uma2 family endonuclease
MPNAVYSENAHCLIVPDVVAEVVEPQDLAYAHRAKVTGWLTAGVRLVLELYPKSNIVFTTRTDESSTRLRSGEILTGEDVLPGFAVPVADLFRLPGEPTPTA